MEPARGAVPYLAGGLHLQAWPPRTSPDYQHPAGAERIEFLDPAEDTAP